MTEYTSSGAPGDPSAGAFEGPAAGETPPPIEPDRASDAEETDAAASTATAEGRTSRTRRRRRGGTRRRRSSRSAEADAAGAGDTAENAPESDPAATEEAPAEAPDEAAAESGTTDTEAPARKRRRRRRRRADKTADEAEADAAEPAEADAAWPGPGDAGEESEEGDDTDGAEADRVTSEDAPVVAGKTAKKRRRRRRGRGGAGKAAAGTSPPEDEDQGSLEAAEEASPEPGAGEGGGTRRRPERRRRGRAGSGPVAVECIPGEEDELGAGDEPGPGAPAEPKRDASQRERAAAGRRSGRANVILVNAADREETRVAVVEGGRIADFQMTSKRHRSLVNDIYRGRVVNLEPAIGAAFIDFGQGRNGFLHTSDVLSAYGAEDWKLEKLLTTKVDPDEWDADSSQPDVAAELAEGGEGAAEPEESDAPARGGKGRGRRERGRGGRSRARPRLPISDLLEKGDGVVVQVTKDAIGDKGPTLTTYISIPGRYLVLMPSMARTGVSRKIEEEKERRRLKRILEGLDVPPGMGVIVRTAGTGCTKAEIKRDLDYLLLLWESFGQRLSLGRGPAPLYEESDVAIRTIRDLFSDDTEAIIVDDEKVHQRVAEFVEKLMPENLDKVKLHDGARPLFHTHNVEQDFERIFARRIDLPSGGSIVLDQTEALVAIDVNSGKTRSDGFDFEDIALRTNLDAVPEIARQIRLRDLGGIIVIDFIDMLKSSHRRQVERALRDALAGDRARSKVGRISQFGLLELTRQRLGPGLSKMLFGNCPRCRGSGRLRTVESRSEAILRRLGSALTLKGFTRVEVRAAPEVVEHLESQYAQALEALEAHHQRELTLVGVPDQVEDSVLRYLRADGREVRPGGRRKR